MKIICTLFMRDEEDVIDEWFKHHHDMFDIFLVTDNGSGDMSAEIAAKYSKVKRLRSEEHTSELQSR